MDEGPERSGVTSVEEDTDIFAPWPVKKMSEMCTRGTLLSRRGRDAGKALASAAKAQGDRQYGAHWAGQGVSLIRELPAAELIRTLARESGF